MKANLLKNSFFTLTKCHHLLPEIQATTKCLTKCDYSLKVELSHGKINENALCSGNEKDSALCVTNTVHNENEDKQNAVLDRLKRYGINFELTKKRDCIFSISEETLKSRFPVYKKIVPQKGERNLNSFLSLMQMSQVDFTFLEKLMIYNNQKVTELSKLLSCAENEVYQLMIKYKFLLRSKPETLQQKVNIILDGGFSLAELKNDLTILTYTSEKLKKRIEMVQSMKLVPKTWMLRCKLNVIQRTWNIREENRLAMTPHPDVKTYLCDKLKISEDQVMDFASRHPPVTKVSVAKMKEIFDLLYSEGFTPIQVFSVPRIFSHSLTTIETRVHALKQKNYKLFSLSIICLSNKKFQELLENPKFFGHGQIKDKMKNIQQKSTCQQNEKHSEDIERSE